MSVDLSTDYLGLTLANPFVVASCPLTGNLNMLERLEGAGAAAAVLPSLFEEQIEREEKILYWLDEHPSESFAESLSYFPNMYDYNAGPDGYLKHIELAKKTVSIPIIASLNGVSRGEWVRFARLLQEAGADALELNIYFVPTDVTLSSQDVEDRYVETVAAVQEMVSLPLAVKLGPFFTALPQFARRLVEAGAKGLVLFNRYLEPEVSLDRLEVLPRLELSRHAELRLPLRWIAILRDQLDVSLAATSGVHTVGDATKALLVGADVAMVASALLRHGPGFLRTLLSEMEHWLEEKQFGSVREIKGTLSRLKSADPAAFERANYMKALASYKDDG